MVLVRKQSKTNTVDVVDGVNASMEQMMENDLPKDIKVDVVRDQSAYIRENVADVWNAILFGGFLALLITYMFLRDFRATIIGGLSIPTSVIATFFLMKSMDFTLNNMSLMALSLAVGILIDDAIVLIENIFRHMEMGKSPIQAAQDATEELSLAILATSLSLMAVFVPIGSMGEVVGQYFKQFGLTVAFALAFSTMAAYTLTPMISAYWLKDYREEHAKPYKHPRPKVVQICLDKFEAGFQVICRMYDELMVFAFQHPWKIVLISVASLIFNLFLLPFIGTEYQPTYDSGEFSVSVKAPAGTSIERMKELTLPLEEEILQMPEVRIAAMRLGGSRVPINEGNIDVKLIPSSDRDRSMIDIMDELRRKFGNVEELKVAVVSNQGGGRGDSRPVQVGLRGSDLELLTTYAQDLAERIRQVPGSTDVDISSSEEEPEIIVKVDPLRASAMGLDSTSVGKVVEMAFLGKSTSNSFTIGDNDYDMQEGYLAEAKKLLPDIVTVPELVQEYSNLSKECGIQFKSVKPPSGNLKQVNGAYEVPLNISISGNYYKMVEFLQKVENGTRFAKLNKASVNTVKENDASGNLDMTAEFTVYSLKDALGKMNTGAAGEKTGLDRVKERDAANMAAIDEAKK
jgi:HAE1 family hydrophobic/amphiphilic exporter-1